MNQPPAPLAAHPPAFPASCRLAFCLLLAAVALLRPPRAAAQGSEEQIADTYRRFAGGYPGASIAIFESVLNEGRLRAFDFAALRYYVAPLFVLEASAPLHPITTPDGTLRYGFNLVAYTDRARTDAAQNLSQTITDPRNGQLVTIRPSSIYDLPHQLVQFRVIGLPEARVLSIGTDLDQNVAYNPVTRITVDIPPGRREFFESLVRSGNLQVEAVITYNARSVNRVQMQVSSASILAAARRRVFDGGGAAYFSADDLEQIVREAATTTDVNILIDPQADAEMVAWVRQFLDTLAAQNFATTAESLADARNLEARLWEGPGIQPADYQPITLLWNVTRDLATVDDYRMANDSVRQYYDENKTSFSASFKAGWGPFSATIRTGWERVTRSEEFFSNQEDLQQFKRENLVEGGVEPRITARGLGLVSSRELETRATSLARVVAVKPTERISEVALQSLVVYDGFDSTDTLQMTKLRHLIETIAVPIGAVISFWGSKAEIEQLSGYELCDGSEVQAVGSPIHKLRKPDLRNRFIMGHDGHQDLRQTIIAGGSNEIPERIFPNSGRTFGTRLTVEQMPRHSHPHQHRLVRIEHRYGDEHLIERPENRNKTITHAQGSGVDSKYTLTSVDSPANAGLSSRDDTPAGGNQEHSHELPKIPAHDNKPSFLGLYYIMRVR
jgi:hypothetical protein